MSLSDILYKYKRLCTRLSNSPLPTIYLTEEEIISIHEEVMEEFGDEATIGVVNGEALTHLVAVPDIEESKPYGLYQEAVEYLVRCARDKPFAAGNTLTGVILALEFLSQNGTEWRGDVVLLECLAKRAEDNPNLDSFFALELFLKATRIG